MKKNSKRKIFLITAISVVAISLPTISIALFQRSSEISNMQIGSYGRRGASTKKFSRQSYFGYNDNSRVYAVVWMQQGSNKNNLTWLDSNKGNGEPNGQGIWEFDIYLESYNYVKFVRINTDVFDNFLTVNKTSLNNLTYENAYIYNESDYTNNEKEYKPLVWNATNDIEIDENLEFYVLTGDNQTGNYGFLSPGKWSCDSGGSVSCP